MGERHDVDQVDGFDSPPPHPALPLARRNRLSFLARNRYQLIGGALLAIALPALVRTGLELDLRLGSAENTIVGTLAAMVFGAFLRRRITAYPGVRATSALLPAFGAAYGLAILIFFFLRLDYSRFQFAASFLIAIVWFGFVGLIEQRLRRPRLLVIPSGRAEDLLGHTGADWVIARTPFEIPEAVTGVVADFRGDLAAGWERLLAQSALAGLPVYHWKQIAESLSGMVDIEHLSENNLGSLLPSSVYRRFKHVIDFAAALAVLPFVVLIVLPTAIAIRLEDGGPVLFRQQRIGFRGRPFSMLKFRTMRGTEQGPAFTKAGDERITKVGRWLRRYRIDELPQIINILRGEMSWIGPRPEAIELAEWYESQIPFYSYRHIVKPGISGWAQVHQGNVAEVQAATGKLRYDFYYIKYFSPWLDLLIAAQTIRTILTGFGAR